MLILNSLSAFLKTTSTMVSFLPSSDSRSEIWKHILRWIFDLTGANESLRTFSPCESLWVRVCVCHLLYEEVVHAAVVVGWAQDVQCIVLPLGGFQIDAADFQAAPSLHLWGWLLVLLTVLDAPGRRCLQIETARRRMTLCPSSKVETNKWLRTNV